MEWKPVPGFSFVEASDNGLIRTVDHVTKVTRGKSVYLCECKGKVLSSVAQKSGHLNVNLPAPKGYKSRQRPYGVHRLVCLAFHGEPPPGKPFALHKDDNPANNVPCNLYWGNQKQNMADRSINIGYATGEAHHKTKLTSEQVAAIKARYKPRTKAHGSFALALEYGVHRTTIENIVKGRTWA